MDEKNIFIALSYYPYRPNKNPKENHFTEALVYILRTDKELLKEIIKKFLDLNGNSTRFLDKLEPDELEIITQEPERIEYGKIISDIEIKVGNKLWIMFENKIDSKLGPKQLEKYIMLLKQSNIKHKFLFFITLFPEKVSKRVSDSEYFIPIIWSEIYEAIKSRFKKVKNNEQKNYLKQFIKYMEMNEMGAFEGFDQKELDIWIKYQKFNKELENFMPKVKQLFLDKGFKKLSSDSYPWNTDGRALSFRNEKNHNNTLIVGFWKYDKQDAYWKPGVYCFVDFVIKGKTWDKIKNSVPSKVYYDSKHRCLTYALLLKDVLGNEKEPEKQITNLLAFYDKALKELIKTDQKYK